MSLTMENLSSIAQGEKFNPKERSVFSSLFKTCDDRFMIFIASSSHTVPSPFVSAHSWWWYGLVLKNLSESELRCFHCFLWSFFYSCLHLYQYCQVSFVILFEGSLWGLGVHLICSLVYHDPFHIFCLFDGDIYCDPSLDL